MTVICDLKSEISRCKTYSDGQNQIKAYSDGQNQIKFCKSNIQMLSSWVALGSRQPLPCQLA